MTLPNFFDFTISTATISAHVLLMRAIHKLQTCVQPGGIPRRQDDGSPQPSETTEAFIRSAVIRFTAWVTGLNANAQKRHDRHDLTVAQMDVPPLDVLMVWHAYMLSPVTYEKDSLSDAGLQLLTHMPLDRIAALVDEISYDFVPSVEQSLAWRDLTGMPFDCLTADHYDHDAIPQISSIDLVQAVIKQSSSIGRMVQEASVYEENSLLWSQATNRYIRFMCLPLGNYVPPVDVDIIWHTHQLKGLQYREDCMKYFGRVINHDDSQPTAVIKKGHQMMNEKASLLFDNEETRISVFAVFTSTPARNSNSNRGDDRGEDGDGSEGEKTTCGPPDGCIRS
ncbi:hypothetical protein PC9H_005645 [Pleurotus ostreatus]|uniref:Uncharacterized protein n=1 Tax=Pleurotus ostreatus TaxID=5322 RepID=A0A8H7A497_PLEOS|nr:uncharacterized protein PC9H_005645 [Pleurotus ostreatus]KAF7433682.1 hypothetical protein PC9H_005645 [Pleurotus ostreatus]